MGDGESDGGGEALQPVAENSSLKYDTKRPHLYVVRPFRLFHKWFLACMLEPK